MLIIKLVFKFVFTYLLFIPVTYAYIDSGSGSIIVQTMIAGVLSIAFAIKMYWYKLKAAFFKLIGRKKEPLTISEEHDESESE